MLQELDSRGRKNPQAFSYDGVLSQGNGLLTIVEDAAQHADLLQKLLNVPDEKAVKLDKGIQMDIDTQLVIISNPDLEAQLNQHADAGGADPLRALKRRLDRREFRYLTNLSLEAELIQARTHERDDSVAGGRVRRTRRPHSGTGRRSGSGRRRHQRARNRATRHRIRRALQRGVPTRRERRARRTRPRRQGASSSTAATCKTATSASRSDDFDFDDDAADGSGGIPVTYTRDIIAGLLNEIRDRHHSDYDVEQVIMPRDVLNAMAEGIGDAPVFSAAERTEYENRLVPVKNYIFQQQESDVLDADHARPACGRRDGRRIHRARLRVGDRRGRRKRTRRAYRTGRAEDEGVRDGTPRSVHRRRLRGESRTESGGGRVPSEQGHHRVEPPRVGEPERGVRSRRRRPEGGSRSSKRC